MATKHICLQNNNWTSYPISFLSSFRLQNICADDSEDKSGVCEHQSGSRFEKGILVAEKIHIFLKVEISLVQIVNKLSPCKFYSQLLKKHQIWKKYVTPGISNRSNLFILHFITYKCKCCWRILLKKRRIYHLIFIITETKNIYLYIY